MIGLQYSMIMNKQQSLPLLTEGNNSITSSIARFKPVPLIMPDTTGGTSSRPLSTKWKIRKGLQVKKRRCDNPFGAVSDSVTCATWSQCSWLRDVKLVDCLRMGGKGNVNSMIKGTGLYLAIRGSDGIASSFVATRATLFS